MNVLTKTILAAVFLALASASAAQTRTYPSRLIKVVVPFPPGGGTDAAGRLIARKLADTLKVDVVVDNKGGAGGNIGAREVANAAPDGYTLLVGTVGTQIVNKVLFPKFDLDPQVAFVPVAWFSGVPNVLIVPADSPHKTAQELIDAGKHSPGGLVYGSGGTGSTTHLAVELFREMTGIRVTHVPYKGSAPALVDLIGGQVDFMIDNLSSALPQIRAGRVRVLGVTTSQRLVSMPEVPALAELPGLSSYEAVGWTGLFAPIATDPVRITILSDAMVERKGADALIRAVEATGSLYVGADRETFARFLDQERNRWEPIARQSAPQ